MLALVVLVALHLPYLDVTGIVFLSHLALISTLYNVPEKSHQLFHFPLRSIPILKIFLIAYVWAATSVFFPVMIADQNIFAHQVILLFTTHLLFIFAITLPFDIRDFHIDTQHRLITIPGLIGVRRTKIIAIVCLWLFGFILWNLIESWTVILFCIMTSVLIILSSPDKKYYYYALIMDGTILIYFWLVLFISL